MYFSFIGLLICASCAILEVSLIRLETSKALKLLLEVRVCAREKQGSDVLAVRTLKSLIRMSRMLVIVVWSKRLMMRANLLENCLFVSFKDLILCFNLLYPRMELFNKLLLIRNDCYLLLISLGSDRKTATRFLLCIVIEVAYRAVVLEIHGLLLLSNLYWLEIYGREFPRDIVYFDVIVDFVSNSCNIFDCLAY